MVPRPLRSWQVSLLVCLVCVSLLLITNLIPINPGGVGLARGLDLGLDFVGGAELQLLLERPMEKDEMSWLVDILSRRLNAYGLKQVEVLSWGDRFIIVRVAGTELAELREIEELLRRQARFEILVAGKLAVKGGEVSLDPRPGGRIVEKVQDGYGWRVGIVLSSEGGERFCRVAGDKLWEPVDMFLDRPFDVLVVVEDPLYSKLEAERYDRKSTCVGFIRERAAVPVIVASNLSADVLENYLAEGKRGALLVGTKSFPTELKVTLEELNFSYTEVLLGNESLGEFCQRLLRDHIGIRSSPILKCDPCTECRNSAEISGFSPRSEEAKRELKEMIALLMTGHLPAKPIIASRSYVSPTLGEKFAEYCLIAGAIALAAVALIVSFRYKRVVVVLPILLTCISEVLLILGFAALVSWSLDLASVAGIIVAVGTGVDDQIVITDEVLRRRPRKEALSIVERVRRAFFIICTAAATTVAVMLPVFGLIHALRGFALVTIVGVLIGILITRPAYAKILEALIG